MPNADDARISLADSSAAAPRARKKKSPARWGALFVLGPHLLLGAWLFAVPDYRAFLVAEAATLVHVGVASITLPPALIWIFMHVRLRSGSGGPPVERVPLSEWLLLAVTLAAFVTGVAVTWGGNIIQGAPLHALAGLGVALPLAWHLWLAGHRPFAVAVIALLATSLGFAALARRLLPPASAAPITPAFAYQTRPASLYEPAATCGECHVQDYDDWKRTTHARGLSLPSVKKDFTEDTDGTTLNLKDLGTIASGQRRSSLRLVSGSCRACHAPVGFYGDDDRSAGTATGTLAEGTTCTVCHTLREVQESSEKRPSFPITDDRFVSASVARMPQYVSAPETVRRYLGQGSDSPIAHRVASWLIRWRPQVHKADYHSEVLDSSRACEGCHSLGGDDPSTPLVYVSWQQSAYNTSDPRTTVTCQDCHMTRHLTGKPVRDPERAVPWGPVRSESRSHLFLGGNVNAANELGDAELAILQHEYNKQALSVKFIQADVSAGVATVTVAVHSDLVGHNFPALESQIRYGWVRIKAFDAANNLVAATDPPRSSTDFDGPSPLIMAPMTDPGRGILRARATLELRTRLVVPESPRVAHLVAEVHQGMDPDAIAMATAPVTLVTGP